MEVINRLNTKKAELEERISNLYHGGSQRGEILKHKIKRIEELIAAYHSTSASAELSEAEEILSQQVGFEEQKKFIFFVIIIEKCILLFDNNEITWETLYSLSSNEVPKRGQPVPTFSNCYFFFIPIYFFLPPKFEQILINNYYIFSI
jgi:hypothetical protein